MEPEYQYEGGGPWPESDALPPGPSIYDRDQSPIKESHIIQIPTPETGSIMDRMLHSEQEIRVHHLHRRPHIVCLCGSTRFSEEYREANLQLTIHGVIVLTVGCDIRSDADLFSELGETDLADLKIRLDTLHLRKIEMADYVLVLNRGGYIGESTSREIAYAKSLGKYVQYLESPL